jgi:hypothetical protein
LSRRERRRAEPAAPWHLFPDGAFRFKRLPMQLSGKSIGDLEAFSDKIIEEVNEGRHARRDVAA